MQIMTLNEVADYLKVHRSSIYRLLKIGEIPGFRMGTDWRFSREAIDEWIVRRTLEAPAQAQQLALERARIRAARSSSI